jgi:hypothetical protein
VGSLLINQHTNRSGSNPASRFPLSFLGGQYYIFLFFCFLFLFYLGGIQVKDRSEDVHPDAANADFFWQQQARGPKNII